MHTFPKITLLSLGFTACGADPAALPIAALPTEPDTADAALDASVADATSDVGVPDARTLDAATDSGKPDTADAGPDANLVDANTADANAVDASTDAGKPDATPDASAVDASTDAGKPDATPEASTPDASTEAGSDAPLPTKRLFVTSKAFAGNFAAGGDPIAIADGHCNAAAKDGQLGGTWVAWLSGRDGNGTLVRAIDRIDNARYVILPGTTAFYGKWSLYPYTSGITNEFGAFLPIPTQWTGSLSNGAPDVANQCTNWTGSGSGAIGTWASSYAWTGYSTYSNLGSCNGSATYRFYCFEK